jgi:molecular chaperone IbpA
MNTLPSLFRDANLLAGPFVGFDRLFENLDQMLSRSPAGTTFPPYNILKTDENGYAIEIAVAGFSADEITVSQEGKELIVRGEQKKEEANYIYKGISSRKFERRFALEDYVQTVDAQFKDGMLVLNLVREIPESIKPRQIAVQA